MNHMLCVGLGYSARHLATRLTANHWQISATTRDPSTGQKNIRQHGYGAHHFDSESGCADFKRATNNPLETTTHLLVSAPPDQNGDPLLGLHEHDLANAKHLSWIGYLSTVGVYGDHSGAWVDEDTPPATVSERSRHRLAAEQAWQAFAKQTGKALHIFRIAGIYGPGRNPLERLRKGTAKRIVKPGQVFNRIHVTDVARALEAAIRYGQQSATVNLADDEPASPSEILVYAAELLGVAPPPEIAFDDANLSPMAASFYAENKRVSNKRLKALLGSGLTYPTYREGLAVLGRAG